MSRSTRRATAQANTLFADEPQGTVKVGDKVTGVEGGEKRVAAIIQKGDDPKPPKAKRTEVAKVVELLPAAKPENLLASLMSSIIDPHVGPEKVKTLVDIRDKLMQEQAHVQFMSAYIAMQAELPSISRDGTIDQGVTKSGREGVKARWATYDNINATCRPILVKHKMGLLLLPDAGPEGVGIIVRGQLGFVCETDFGKIVHIERCTIPVPNDPTGGKSPPQGIGSALSYGKRYGAIALLNLVSHAPDDADTDARTKAPKKEPAKISAEEVTKLKQAIAFCGSTPEEFCPFYKIAKIEDLPAAQFAEAMDACRRRAEGSGIATTEAKNG